MSNEQKTFDVPQNVRAAAKQGLELRQKHGRGGLDSRQAGKLGIGSGVQRASDLVSGKVSYRTIKMMVGFFARHSAYKEHHSDKTSAAWISWQLWGGYAGAAWAKRIVEQEEKVEKGGLLYNALFGEDYPATDSTLDLATDSTPTDSTPQVVEKASTFSFLEALRATKKDNTLKIPAKYGELVEVAQDEQMTVDDIQPVMPPKDAEQPTEEPLSEAELTQLQAAETDAQAEQVAKKSLHIDLKISPKQHSHLKKLIKGLRTAPSVATEAAQIAKCIMRGEWAKLDTKKLLEFLQDPQSLNARVCGGTYMLSLIENAKMQKGVVEIDLMDDYTQAPRKFPEEVPTEPPVPAEPPLEPQLQEVFETEDLDKGEYPAKYFTGLTQEEAAKRKKELDARKEGKDSYKPLEGDDAKTKPSQYSKTEVAAKIREEVKEPTKDDFLRAAAKVSGVARSIIEKVYDRGLKAWATSGHRPGATAQQWAKARVYSFLSGGKTRTTADKDLWGQHLENMRD